MARGQELAAAGSRGRAGWTRRPGDARRPGPQVGRAHIGTQWCSLVGVPARKEARVAEQSAQRRRIGQAAPGAASPSGQQRQERDQPFLLKTRPCARGLGRVQPIGDPGGEAGVARGQPQNGPGRTGRQQATQVCAWLKRGSPRLWAQARREGWRGYVRAIERLEFGHPIEGSVIKVWAHDRGCVIVPELASNLRAVLRQF